MGMGDIENNHRNLNSIGKVTETFLVTGGITYLDLENPCLR